MDDVKLLDHGYLRFIESWGSDERIIESARMSTNKGFEGWGREPEMVCPTCGYTRAWALVPLGADVHNIPCGCQHPPVMMVRKDYPRGDEKLLEYLWKHKHGTPFEMAGMTIEVQAPIMVFREWHRHRTQSYNEMSARYTPLPDVNYIPTPNRCLVVKGSNKQANAIDAADTLTHGKVIDWLQQLDGVYTEAERVYQTGLQYGIPKELARLPVPVGRYSRMRASANLRNWLGFLTLRMDDAAQWEIRQYANAVGTFIEKKFPRTWKLFIS